MGADEFDRLLGALTSGELDRDDLPIAPADRALLRYANKLTLTPGAITAADVGALRHAGFDDRAIHDACAIVGYFAFVNRIADGLGVELEEK
jgi:alkylhydroperoxidase family enzyme